MRILVCAKQVPNTNQITINPETNTLERSGVWSIQNPLDTLALKMALQIKKLWGGTVSMLTMGPKQAEKILHEGYMLGIDAAYLLNDPSFSGSDTFATSSILARAVEVIGKNAAFDLILCGKKAVDGETGQVGPSLAEHLNMGQMTNVDEIRVENGSILARQITDTGHRWLSSKGPVVITVTEGNTPPMFYHGKDIQRKKDPHITYLSASDLREIDPQCSMGLRGSKTKVVSTFMPASKRKNSMLTHGSAEKDVATLLEILQSESLLK